MRGVAVALVLVGCGQEPDLDAVFVDLAESLATDVLRAAEAEVEAASGIDRFAMEPGDTASGAIQLPAGSDPGAFDGALTLDWALAYDEEPIAGDRIWAWAFGLEIEALVLPSAEVRGSGVWIVRDRLTEIRSDTHQLVGQLGIDGGDLQPIALDALHSGNLHWARGTLGARGIDWENPNPDLP